MDEEKGIELPVGTLVLCDTQQMFFSCRDAFGPTMRVDFAKLRELIEGQLKDDPPHSWCEFQAYVIAYQNYDVTKFVSMLKKFGYVVNEKQVATFETSGRGSNVKENSCSRNIIADAVIKKDIYKRFVFVTGEGGILSAVRTLKALGKEIWVVAFPGSLNQTLAMEVDRTILLTENVIWTQEIEKRINAAKAEQSGRQ